MRRRSYPSPRHCCFILIVGTLLDGKIKTYRASNGVEADTGGGNQISSDVSDDCPSEIRLMVSHCFHLLSQGRQPLQQATVIVVCVSSDFCPCLFGVKRKRCRDILKDVVVVPEAAVTLCHVENHRRGDSQSFSSVTCTSPPTGTSVRLW